MQINQTNRFKKAYKKLHSNQLNEVNEAIAQVIKNPDIGEQKRGNLSWLRVYKFNVLKQLSLLGYSIDKKGEIILTFVALGSHENFYRDLGNQYDTPPLAYPLLQVHQKILVSGTFA